MEIYDEYMTLLPKQMNKGLKQWMKLWLLKKQSV